MNEEQARKSFQEILDKLYADNINFSETNLNTPNGQIGFVEYHIQRFLGECGGVWNDAKAAQYVSALNAEFDSRES